MGLSTSSLTRLSQAIAKWDGRTTFRIGLTRIRRATRSVAMLLSGTPQCLTRRAPSAQHTTFWRGFGWGIQSGSPSTPQIAKPYFNPSLVSDYGPLWDELDQGDLFDWADSLKAKYGIAMPMEPA